MGYETDLYGDIDLSMATNAQLKAIKNRLKEMDIDEEDIYIYVDGRNISLTIGCYWKNYWEFSGKFPGFDNTKKEDNTILQVLRRLAIFFPNEAKGNVCASGEDSDDLWVLKIEGKNITLQEADITYVDKMTYEPPEEAMLSVASIMVQLQGGK